MPRSSYLLTIIVMSAAIPVVAQQTATELVSAANAAIVTDDYDQALGLLGKAAAAARGNPAVLADIAEIRRNAGSLQKSFAKLDRAREALSRSPNDPTANAALGRFYAFEKGELERGLKMLVKSDDEELRPVAALDLRQPSSLEEQVRLGDAWHEIAGSSRDKSQVSTATLRARHWYLMAANSIADERERKPIYEKLDLLRLYPTKIVLVNSHNGNYRDRGTLSANLKLLLDGEVVLTRPLLMQWAERSSVPTTIRLPRTQADAVQIDVLTWQGLGGSIAEIEAYQDGVNLALGRHTASSGEHAEQHRAENLTDGDYGGEFEQGGIWNLPDDTPGWARIFLDRP